MQTYIVRSINDVSTASKQRMTLSVGGRRASERSAGCCWLPAPRSNRRAPAPLGGASASRLAHRRCPTNPRVCRAKFGFCVVGVASVRSLSHKGSDRVLVVWWSLAAGLQNTTILGRSRSGSTFLCAQKRAKRNASASCS